jgi:hypothetical protein
MLIRLIGGRSTPIETAPNAPGFVSFRFSDSTGSKRPDAAKQPRFGVDRVLGQNAVVVNATERLPPRLAAHRYFCSGAVGQWDSSGCMSANDEFCTPVPADVTV